MSNVTWSINAGIATVKLSNPHRANALDVGGWHGLRAAFNAIDADARARVVVLLGDGAHFCAGMDLSVLADLRVQAGAATGCDGRDREALAHWILDLQDCVTSIERCRLPVIAAVHGVCFGGGVDIISACDIRVATHDARFSVKEVDLAVTADLGVLQRLPRIVGEGRAREFALTACEFDGAYAERIGLVTKMYESPAVMTEGVGQLAESMAARSPLALRGTKRAALVARDDGVASGLRQVALWNAATLLSEDLGNAISAQREKRQAQYRD